MRLFKVVDARTGRDTQPTTVLIMGSECEPGTVGLVFEAERILGHVYTVGFPGVGARWIVAPISHVFTRGHHTEEPISSYTWWVS